MLGVLAVEEATRGLGRFVRDRRVELGMNQTDLGIAIGRDQGYISELERGVLVNLPPIDVLRALARELHCDTADLLAAAGYLDPVEEDEADSADDEQRIWTAMMGDIDRLPVSPSLKAHMRQTAEFVRKLAKEQG